MVANLLRRGRWLLLLRRLLLLQRLLQRVGLLVLLVWLQKVRLLVLQVWLLDGALRLQMLLRRGWWQLLVRW